MITMNTYYENKYNILLMKKLIFHVFIMYLFTWIVYNELIKKNQYSLYYFKYKII